MEAEGAVRVLSALPACSNLSFDFTLALNVGFRPSSLDRGWPTGIRDTGPSVRKGTAEGKQFPSGGGQAAGRELP